MTHLTRTPLRPQRRFLMAFFAAMLWTLALPAIAAEAATDATVAGVWAGEITLPTGALEIRVTLTEGAADEEAASDSGSSGTSSGNSDASWSGTIDIPAQGAQGLALADFTVSGTAAKFSIAGVPGNPTFEGTLQEGELRGDFRQGGARFDFRLERATGEALAEPQRPQEPKEPFPYQSHAVSFGHGEITLAGTLTVPAGEGPFPAAVLISGSGPQNRDEELMGHKPFWVLADHLTRAGIAVLRYDDRGFGESTGDFSTATSNDFATDAAAAVAFLAERPEIAGDRVGLVGHSEGGLVGPLLASRSNQVAFVVMLAGPGVPGDQIVLRQTEKIALAGGISQEEIQNDLATLREAFDVIKSEKDEAARQAKLEAVIQSALARLSEAERTALGENAEAVVRGQFAQLSTPWFRNFLQYDPAPALRKVRVPVLAINGGLDLQVLPEQNLPPIRKALEASGNPDFTVQELPGLNHLFQSAETGSPSEYMSIEETFSPEAMDLVSAWILERFGPGAAAAKKAEMD